MTNLTKTVVGLSFVFSLLAMVGVWNIGHPNLGIQAGAVGVKLAENYDPYLKYNGGYYSALPVQTTSMFTSNGLTVNTSNTATSTTQLGCVQLYATSTATAIHLEFSTTTVLASYPLGTVPTGAVAWRYGACPV